MLNGLWLAIFLVAFATAAGRWLLGGETDVFAAIVEQLFAMARLSVELMVLLFGTLTLWLGLLRIGEQAGVIEVLARAMGPLLRRIMPEVPKDHPALGYVTLNFAANGIGIDTAATPIGLKAMRELQGLNTSQTSVSNAQAMFLVLNASSLTLLPITIFMYRIQQGSTDPTAVFLPILLATTASTTAGFLAVALVQRIRLWDPVLLAWLLGIAGSLGLMISALAGLTASALSATSSLVGNLALLMVIVGFLVAGAWRRVPVYESFVDGARQGFDVARDLLPYLVAMLCAIGALRASGALDALLAALRGGVMGLGLDARFVDALPVALMKPFSGSGARALMVETMQAHGVDSFPALLAATFQGSTETTFYVLAVYLGAVGLRRARHALPCALLADLAGFAAAIAVAYWFWG